VKRDTCLSVTNNIRSNDLSTDSTSASTLSNLSKHTSRTWKLLYNLYLCIWTRLDTVWKWCKRI